MADEGEGGIVPLTLELRTTCQLHSAFNHPRLSPQWKLDFNFKLGPELHSRVEAGCERSEAMLVCETPPKRIFGFGLYAFIRLQT